MIAVLRMLSAQEDRELWSQNSGVQAEGDMPLWVWKYRAEAFQFHWEVMTDSREVAIFVSNTKGSGPEFDHQALGVGQVTNRTECIKPKNLKNVV